MWNISNGDEPTVIIAGPQDADRVFGVLTLAFAMDPPNRWMYPEPVQYLRHFPTFARALGGEALPLRTTFVNQDYSAAALWLAPGAGPNEQTLMKVMEESVAPEKKVDLVAVIERDGQLPSKGAPLVPAIYWSGSRSAGQGSWIGDIAAGPCGM